MNNKDRKNFFEFLLLAKRNTYASGGQDTRVSIPLVPASKQLDWKSGNWLYRDIYFGMTRFSGMETVYWHSNPVWSMGYFGGIRPETSEGLVKPAYSFLQKALAQASREHPYRGPQSYTLDNWVYRSVLYGDENQFDGTEEVWCDEQSLYLLNFAGGFII